MSTDEKRPARGSVARTPSAKLRPPKPARPVRAKPPKRAKLREARAVATRKLTLPPSRRSPVKMSPTVRSPEEEAEIQRRREVRDAARSRRSETEGEP